MAPVEAHDAADFSLRQVSIVVDRFDLSKQGQARPRRICLQRKGITPACQTVSGSLASPLPRYVEYLLPSACLVHLGDPALVACCKNINTVVYKVLAWFGLDCVPDEELLSPPNVAIIPVQLPIFPEFSMVSMTLECQLERYITGDDQKFCGPIFPY